MSAGSYLALALIAGLLAVERRAFLQAMASRPLVAATLLGLAAGRPAEALALGAALELFFLGAVNMGMALPENDLFATAASASCLAALLGAGVRPALAAMAVSVLAGLPAARLGRFADAVADRFNAWLAARPPRHRTLTARLRANVYGVWVPFIVTALVALAGAVIGGHLLAPLLERAPDALIARLPLVWGGFLMVAAAAALRSIHTARSALYALAAALVCAGAQAARLLVG